MSRLTWTTVILFAGAVAARLVFYLLTGYTADDAFITFRYAENLAYGLGFVYNDGQHVLGTTTPLYTFLLAITALLHIPAVIASLIVSLTASGLTAVLLYRYARSLRFTAFAILPAIAYILWPRSLPADISGMETALFAFFVTAAFYYQQKRFEVYALGMATLATLTRPEGLLVLALLLIYNLIRNSRFALIYIATPAIMLLPWIIFAWLYFGSPIPNSMVAKMALYSQFGTMSLLQSLVYLLGLHTPFGWVLLVAVVLGAWWIYSKQYTGKLELLWIALTILALTFSRAHLFHWYIAPIYPLYLLFASASVIWVLHKFNLTPPQLRAAASVVAVLLIALLLIGDVPQAKFFKKEQETLNDVHRAVGYYLFAQSPQKAVVAAEDIGYSGYYSHRHILDRDGLVSPEAAVFNRQGRYLDLLLTTNPDYVVANTQSPISPFLNQPEFTDRYQLEKTFSHDSTEYRIYIRR